MVAACHTRAERGMGMAERILASPAIPASSRATIAVSASLTSFGATIMRRLHFTRVSNERK